MLYGNNIKFLKMFFKELLSWVSGLVLPYPFPAGLSRLPFPGCPFLAVIYLAVQFGCVVLAVRSWLSCPVLAVLSWLSQFSSLKVVQ
jgi:hypothetical protein